MAVERGIGAVYRRRPRLSKTTVKRNNRTKGGNGFVSRSTRTVLRLWWWVSKTLCQWCNKAGSEPTRWIYGGRGRSQEAANFRGSVQGVIIRWPMCREKCIHASPFSSFHHGVKSNIHLFGIPQLIRPIRLLFEIICIAKSINLSIY